MLCCGDSITPGGVHYGNAAFGGFGDVHIVQADTSPPNHLEFGGSFQNLCRSFGGTSDGQGIVISNDFFKLFWSKACDYIHINAVFVLEDFNSSFTHFIAYQDLHLIMPPLQRIP